MSLKVIYYLYWSYILSQFFGLFAQNAAFGERTLSSHWRRIAEALGAQNASGGSWQKRVAVFLGATGASGGPWPKRIAMLNGPLQTKGSWERRLTPATESNGQSWAERLLNSGSLDSAPRINLSSLAVVENTVNGAVIGTASLTGNYTGTPAWSVTDPLGAITINASTGVYSVADTTKLNYEDRQSFAVTFSVSGITPVASNKPADIDITNVLEVTLQALTLDNFDAEVDTPWSAIISNTTSGSNITATASDGTTLTVTDTTVSGTFTVAGDVDITLTETHPDATSRDSVITITVADVGGTLDFSREGNPLIGAI